MSAEQFHLRHLHAAGRIALCGGEDEAVFQVGGAVVEQDRLLLEARGVGLHRSARDRGEAHAIIGTFQGVSPGIAFRTVIGRSQGQALHHAQADGRRDGEAGVHLVKVQILRRLVVDGVGHAFRTRIVVRRSHDGIARLSDVLELRLDISAESRRQTGDEAIEEFFMTSHNTMFPFVGWLVYGFASEPRQTKTIQGYTALQSMETPPRPAESFWNTPVVLNSSPRSQPRCCQKFTLTLLWRLMKPARKTSLLPCA